MVAQTTPAVQMEGEGEAKQNGPPAGMPPPSGAFEALQEATMIDLNDTPVPFASFYKDVCSSSRP